MSTPPVKVAREVAEADFARMCGPFRVELDADHLNDEERVENMETREKLVRLIMRGLLVVGDDGNPTYTPPGRASGFTFHPVKATALIALETYAQSKPISNMCCCMADMTRVDRTEFHRLDLPDFHALSNLAKLFLADRV